MSQMTPDDLDEEYIASARVLHISGITLALSDSCRQTAIRAMQIAKDNGVYVTFDPNYRPQLWSEDEAHRAFQSILPYVDALLPGEDEAKLFLSQSMDLTGASSTQIVEELVGLGIESVYLKQGELGASYWVSGETGFEPAVKVDVVDTVGAGDAFAAGVIAGYLEGMSPRDTTRLANVMGALVTTAVGDTEGVTDRATVDHWLSLVSRP